ncbi:aryl-sulfate sulfotransferase [Candidatus Neomarinimicrobiota bacterium]
MKIPSKNYIINTFTIIFIILISNNQGMSQNTVGLILNDAQSYNGYTLFAPNLAKITYLIDNDGNLVHQWESNFIPGMSAYLLEDGHLLRAAANLDPTGNSARTGGFQKFDWDGTLVWDYYIGTQHHDIEPLPNGNVLLVLNDRKTEAAAIQAGRDPDLIDEGNIRSLSIVELEQTDLETADVVWRWNAWDHLIQNFDGTKDNLGVIADHPELIDINFAKNGSPDWLHTNSVSYNEALDQIIVSNRSTNEIWVIDHSTTTEVAATHEGGNSEKGGDLLYRWGNPIAYGAGTIGDQKLHGQHDAHWIEQGLPGEGNIMIFNNGWPDRGYSSIEELVPPVDGNGYIPLTPGTAHEPSTQLWTYTTPAQTDFSSDRFGGSQRLPNGNTLICNSDKGEFFEVTSSNEIVWKYQNPVDGSTILNQGDQPVGNLQVFRCYKYSLDYPAFTGKDLTPGEPIELYPTTAVNDDGSRITKFTLYDSYPNPFNPITNIEFSLNERINVTITIYDLVGNTIKTLVNDVLESGLNTITWDSRDKNDALVSSGIYFYSLQAGQQNQTKKMMLLR